MAQINISGTVSDTLGNPIKGAIVLLKNAGRKGHDPMRAGRLRHFGPARPPIYQ